jgi:hypothetical protein
MDEIDRAQEREEKDRAWCLAQRKPVLAPCGICHNCAESVEGCAEFCDADCREDYELRESSRARSGRW